MEMLEDQLEKVFLQLGAGPLQLIRELDQLERDSLQMIEKPDQLGIWRPRLERGDLGVGEVSEVMIKGIYLIVVRLRQVIRVVKDCRPEAEDLRLQTFL